MSNILHNAVNAMWPRYDEAAACGSIASGQPVFQVPSGLARQLMTQQRNKPLFNARVTVIKAANGYMLTISTDDYAEGTTYIAHDLAEVLQLLQAAMAAVQLEDK